MSTDSLYSIVMRAAREIAGNGQLRSQLRRADKAMEVFGLAEASHFDQKLRTHLKTIPRDSTLPDEVLILLAQRNVAVPKDAGSERPTITPLATQLGGAKEDDRALSGLRFQRLMHAQAGDDRLRQMRRALSLLNQPAHPIAVVEAYLALQHESSARRFANTYFTGSEVAAEPNPTETQSVEGSTP